MSGAFADAPSSDRTTDGVWHATTSMAGGLTSHLLTRSWPTVRGGARPSLCGDARHRGWQPVDQFGKPDAFTCCHTCKHLAQEVAVVVDADPEPGPAPEPETPTVRIAPTALQVVATTHRAPGVRAQLLDPQHAAAGLPPDHRIFRPRFGRRAEPSYTPTAYEAPAALAWTPGDDVADEAS